MNRTQISNRSNTSSLFSEDNDGRNTGSRSPAKRLYSKEPDFQTKSENIETSDKEESKFDSDSTKKIESRKFIIPPPLSLLPKSQIPNEPIRTGNNMPFLKLTMTKGGSNIVVDKMHEYNPKDKIKEIEDMEVSKGKRQFKSMFYIELKG